MFNFEDVLEVDGAASPQSHTIRLYAGESFIGIDAGYEPITAMKMFEMVGKLSSVKALKESVTEAELWCGGKLVSVEHMPVRLDNGI